MMALVWSWPNLPRQELLFHVQVILILYQFESIKPYVCEGNDMLFPPLRAYFEGMSTKKKQESHYTTLTISLQNLYHHARAKINIFRDGPVRCCVATICKRGSEEKENCVPLCDNPRAGNEELNAISADALELHSTPQQK